MFENLNGTEAAVRMRNREKLIESEQSESEQCAVAACTDRQNPAAVFRGWVLFWNSISSGVFTDASSALRRTIARGRMRLGSRLRGTIRVCR